MKPVDFLTRRDALKAMGAGAAFLGLGLLPSPGLAAAAPAVGQTPPFTLPKLAFDYAALEPHIDARTMEIHHTKHHQAYIKNANDALKDHPELHGSTSAQLLQKLPEMPEKIRTVLRNNVGGHANHSFFWQILAPSAGGAPSGVLAAAIDRTFGSFAAFKVQFADVAVRRFGSGWAWLSVKGGALVVHSTANQDSPLSDGAVPVLGLDVWEHAYYLKYQNVRADYVKAFWNVANWRQAEANHASAMA